VLLAAAAFTSFSCCGCPAYYAFFAPWWGETQAKQLQADLDEHLPDGSSREQAVAWLASHGLTHYDRDYGDVVKIPVGGQVRDGVRCGLWGKIATSALITKAWIDIRIDLDANDKVRGRKVVYVPDGF
jgi:hypothetical protein